MALILIETALFIYPAIHTLGLSREPFTKRVGIPGKVKTNIFSRLNQGDTCRGSVYFGVFVPRASEVFFLLEAFPLDFSAAFLKNKN